MRILLVGAGGVGTGLARIAARRPFAELVIADYDLARAQRAASVRDGFQAVQLDARDERAVLELLTQRRCDVLMNATDPRFVMPLFRAALEAGIHYLDMAMSLSHPDREDPYSRTGVKLGDDQFAMAPAWDWAGKLALVGMGVEPGLSDVFARYAADELFSRIDELGVRDGANLEVAGYDFAPTFSIWTTIEECLNPPVVWERDRGWFTTEPFSEPEVFAFPAGIGPVECVNVEHEEGLLMPRWIEAQRGTFKYGPGAGAGRRRDRVAARRGGRVPPGPGHAGGGDDRPDLCRHLGHRDRDRRGAPRGVPALRGGQRLVDGRVRVPGGGLADCGQSRGRHGTHRLGGLVRHRRARPGGAPAPAVPGPARRLRLTVGVRRTHAHRRVRPGVSGFRSRRGSG